MNHFFLSIFPIGVRSVFAQRPRAAGKPGPGDSPMVNPREMVLSFTPPRQCQERYRATTTLSTNLSSRLTVASGNALGLQHGGDMVFTRRWGKERGWRGSTGSLSIHWYSAVWELTLRGREVQSEGRAECSDFGSTGGGAI